MVNSNEAAVHFVAPDIAFEDAWTVPSSAVWPLAYWIVFNSCVAYGLITFVSQVALDFSARACRLANQETITIRATSTPRHRPCLPTRHCSPARRRCSHGCWLHSPGKKHGLKEPGENSLGGIAVLLGLFLILRDVRAQEKAEAGADSERERLLSER